MKIATVADALQHVEDEVRRAQRQAERRLLTAAVQVPGFDADQVDQMIADARAEFESWWAAYLPQLRAELAKGLRVDDHQGP